MIVQAGKISAATAQRDRILLVSRIAVLADKLAPSLAPALRAPWEDAIQYVGTMGPVTIAEISVHRHSENLRRALLALYKRAAMVFGNLADQELGAAVVEKKSLADMFWQAQNAWALKNAATKVKDINKVTEGRIRTTIRYGLDAGATNYDITKMLREQQGLSKLRAARIARTETHTASVHAIQESTRVRAEELELVMMRVWTSANDARTRSAHRKANGQERGMEEPFDVGGEKLMFPGDPAGRADNVINCRCVLQYRQDKRGKVPVKPTPPPSVTPDRDRYAGFGINKDVDTSNLPLARGAAWKDLSNHKYRTLLEERARDGELIEIVPSMDDLYKYATHPDFVSRHDTTVYFGLQGDKFKGMKVGDQFSALGARSAAYEKNRALTYAGDRGTVFELMVPKGNRLVHAKVLDVREAVLLPGSKFRVVSLMDDGTVKLELLSDGAEYIKELKSFQDRLIALAAKLKPPPMKPVSEQPPLIQPEGFVRAGSLDESIDGFRKLNISVGTDLEELGYTAQGELLKGVEDARKVVSEMHDTFPGLDRMVTRSPGKGIESLKVFNSDTVLFGEDGVRGHYIPPKRELRISDRLVRNSSSVPNVNPDTFLVADDYASTLRHEYGHHVERSLLSEEETISFRNLFSPPDEFGRPTWSDFGHGRRETEERAARFFGRVSKYAGTNQSEGFAECFSAYTSPNYHLAKKKLPRKLEGFFEKLLGKKGT